jgi:hypothetical protein
MKHHHRQWFFDWLDGLAVRQIAKRVGKSHQTIHREINYFLSRAPKLKIIPNQNAHLCIDGTYFKRANCLILHFDHDLKYHQLCRYSTAEKELETEKDLRALKRNGVNIVSATTDGSFSLKLALMRVFPNAIHQRCLVHIQRYCEIYLTQNPKMEAGIKLREIAKIINTVNTYQQAMLFKTRVFEWERKYELFLKEKTYFENGRCQYTHRNLRRVINHLKEALPDMFHYLDNERIPKDTNGLEGRLTDLKHKFRTHRGLRKTKREQYLKWYLFIKNKQK